MAGDKRVDADELFSRLEPDLAKESAPIRRKLIEDNKKLIDAWNEAKKLQKRLQYVKEGLNEKNVTKPANDLLRPSATGAQHASSATPWPRPCLSLPPACPCRSFHGGFRDHPNSVGPSLAALGPVYHELDEPHTCPTRARAPRSHWVTKFTRLESVHTQTRRVDRRGGRVGSVPQRARRRRAVGARPFQRLLR